MNQQMLSNYVSKKLPYFVYLYSMWYCIYLTLTVLVCLNIKRKVDVKDAPVKKLMSTG